MSALFPFRVFLIEFPDPGFTLADAEEPTAFECEAEDIDHAIEQARDAYPDGQIVSAALDTVGGDGPVRRDGESNDLTHRVEAGSFWLTVRNVNVWVRVQEDRLRVDLIPRGCEDDQEASPRTPDAAMVRFDAAAATAFGFLGGDIDPDRCNALTDQQIEAHLSALPVGIADSIRKQLVELND